MIYKAFETGLKDYVCFLLGFATRSEEIRESAIINSIARQRFINLVEEGKNLKEVSHIIITDLLLSV